MGLETLIKIINEYNVVIYKKVPSYPDVNQKIIYIGISDNSDLEIRKFLRGAVMSHPIFHGYSLESMQGKPRRRENDDLINRLVEEAYQDENVLNIVKEKLDLYLKLL